LSGGIFVFIVGDGKLSYPLECRAEQDESNLAESVLAHAS
jgi:hypothetical protein